MCDVTPSSKQCHIEVMRILGGCFSYGGIVFPYSICLPVCMPLCAGIQSEMVIRNGDF